MHRACWLHLVSAPFSDQRDQIIRSSESFVASKNNNSDTMWWSKLWIHLAAQYGVTNPPKQEAPGTHAEWRSASILHAGRDELLSAKWCELMCIKIQIPDASRAFEVDHHDLPAHVGLWSVKGGRMIRSLATGFVALAVQVWSTEVLGRLNFSFGGSINMHKRTLKIN